MKTTLSERMLTGREIARQIGVAPNTIQRWAKAGRIPSVRLSARCIRFDSEIVLKALTERQTKGGAK